MKIDPKYIGKSISFEAYKHLVTSLYEEGKVTGPIQNEELLHYTGLNIQRMHRVEKTTHLTEELITSLLKIRKPQIWLALSEGWCGDAAQIIPLFSIIEKHCSMIKFSLLLRDENPELMDQFLTNGSRSIPIVLIIDADSLELLSKWGPRPKEATNIINDLKATQTAYASIKEKLHLWYAKNKGLALQSEIIDLIEDIMV